MRVLRVLVKELDLEGVKAVEAKERGREKEAETAIDRLLQALKSPRSSLPGSRSSTPPPRSPPKFVFQQHELESDEEVEPIVTLRLNEQQRETSAGKSASRWHWNEEFTFRLRHEDGSGEKKPQERLDIICRNGNSENMQLIGYTSIPLDRLKDAKGKLEKWYELLSPAASQDQTSTGGVILLSFEFLSVSASRTQSLPNLYKDEKLSVEKGGKKLKQRRASDKETTVKSKAYTERMPDRLAEYFLVIRVPGESEETTEPVGYLEPEILHRYPAKDHSDLALPMKIEWFCCANSRRLHNRNPEFYTFVHAPRGIRLYGYCMMFYSEPYEATMCCCYVSRLGLGQVFEDCLVRVVKLAETFIEVGELSEFWEKAARRLIEEVPIPVPGLLRVLFPFDLGRTVTNNYYSCVIGKYGGFPSFTFEKGLDLVLKNFDIASLINLWTAALLECKILIHSTKTESLTLLSETILCLLYPFRWLHTYIPLLPKEILECIQAPLPFIIGMHSENMSLISEQDLREVVLVDVNTGTVTCGIDLNLPSLPEREHRRLFRMLRLLYCGPPLSLVESDADWNDDVEPLFTHETEEIVEPSGSCSCRVFGYNTRAQEFSRKVQLCFIECIASMLQGYQECLFLLNKRLPVFNQPQFLEMRGADSLFFMKLLQTQAFELFKETQESKWLQLFHSCYYHISVRFRDREQLLALSDQKAKTQVVEIPESRWRTSIEQNEHIWESRERRCFCSKSSQCCGHGLETISLHKQDEVLQKQWTSTLVIGEDSDEGTFDVEKVAARCNLSIEKLSEGLEDLDLMMGTSQFRIKESQDCGDDYIRPDGRSSSGKQPVGRRGGLKKYATDVHPGLLKGIDYSDMEKTLQETITRIFLNKRVESKQVDSCRKCFMASQHSRDVFVLILYQPRNNRATGSDSRKRNVSVLSMSGRGLRSDAFEGLVRLSRALIDACARHEDYSNGRQMLELSRSYFVEETNTAQNTVQNNIDQVVPDIAYTRRRSSVIGDYLETRLKGLDLWQSLMFWERAFGDTLAAESRKRGRSLSSALQGYGNGNVGLDRDEGRQDSLFQIATNMVYTMIRLDVDIEKVKALVSRIVSVHGLKAEHEVTLSTLISNITRAGSIAS